MIQVAFIYAAQVGQSSATLIIYKVNNNIEFSKENREFLSII
jgi:hypothetical protein